MKQFSCRRFVVRVLSHPVQHPSVDILRVSGDMQSGIEPKNYVTVSVTYVNVQMQQSSFVKNIEDWSEARNFFHVTVRNMLVLKHFVPPIEHRGIVV